MLVCLNPSRRESRGWAFCLVLGWHEGSAPLTSRNVLMSSAVALFASGSLSLFACSATMGVTLRGHDDGESFTPALHFLLQDGILSPVPVWLLTIFSRALHRPLTSLPPKVENMRTLILNSLEIHHFRRFRQLEIARPSCVKLILTRKNSRQNATDLPCIFS